MLSAKKFVSICACLVLSSVMMICCSQKPAEKAGLGEGAVSTNAPVQQPALGVEIPKLMMAADVKKYMRELLSAPLPSNYVLPEDVRNAGDYERSVAKVNEHFPEFEGLESNDLLRAVKANPRRYQELMLEARSVREFYHPGSQPKQNK